MIIDGLKLAVIGMTVVFAFLGLLVLIVQISTKLLKPFTEKEEREMAVPAGRTSPIDGSRLVAVVSAAIASHRTARNSNRTG